MKTYYNIDVKYKAAAVLRKIYTQNHLYFNWEFFKTLHTCLLLYADLHIITAQNSLEITKW